MKTFHFCFSYYYWYCCCYCRYYHYYLFLEIIIVVVFVIGVNTGFAVRVWSSIVFSFVCSFYLLPTVLRLYFFIIFIVFIGVVAAPSIVSEQFVYLLAIS